MEQSGGSPCPRVCLSPLHLPARVQSLFLPPGDRVGSQSQLCLLSVSGQALGPAPQFAEAISIFFAFSPLAEATCRNLGCLVLPGAAWCP